MKKTRIFGQFLDVIYKILFAFIIVFLLYFLGKLLNSSSYDYFVFPFIAVVIIFICGVDVGKSLEKMKHHESSGVFTKNNDNKKKETSITEFYVDDTKQIITNKKVLKDLEEGNKVHIKTYEINEQEDTNEEEIVEQTEESVE